MAARQKLMTFHDGLGDAMAVVTCVKLLEEGEAPRPCTMGDSVTDWRGSQSNRRYICSPEY